MADVTIINSLYKYCAPERIDIFLTGKIRFTQPSEFNDPFDCNPALLPRLNASREHRAKRKAHRKALFDRLNKYGILSTSRCRNALAMWSYYAYGHQGFMIEFRPEKLQNFIGGKFGTKTGTPMPVIYQSARPNSKHSEFNLMRTKSEFWGHEREWRVILPLDKAATKIGPIHLFDLPAAAIRSVHLGCMMSEQRCSEYAAVIRKYDPAIKIIRKKMSLKKYRLLTNEEAI